MPMMLTVVDHAQDNPGDEVEILKCEDCMAGMLVIGLGLKAELPSTCLLADVLLHVIFKC